MPHRFSISRLLHAPRDLVWEVLSQAEHLPHWYGPKGSKITHSTLDFRAGGTFHYCLKSPDSPTLWGKWLLQEIVATEKLVVIQHFSDPQGRVTRNPWAPMWPLYTRSTTTLEDRGDDTLLTIDGLPHEASAPEYSLFAASHASLAQGWSGSLDVLEAYLSQLTAKV